MAETIAVAARGVVVEDALAPDTDLAPRAPVAAGLGVVGDAPELGELGIARLAFRAGGRAHCGQLWAVFE